MAVEVFIDIDGAPDGLTEFFDLVTRACFDAEGIDLALMTIRIVEGDEIRRLNRETRDVDSETDVLSFPAVNYPKGKTARECPGRLRREYDPQAGMPFLGDCVISLNRARAQAEEFGHSLRRELGYLAAHSAFHLLGYDHMNDADKLKMRAMEKRAMREVMLWRDETMSDERLFELACEAMENAYAPYSKYKVGACLLTSDGRTFKGCNFENASFGSTICAERCAAGNAIVNGAREFTAIAVVGSGSVAWPCGICRQVLNEFAVPGMRVIAGHYGNGFVVKNLADLLPESFGPSDLNVERGI